MTGKKLLGVAIILGLCFFLWLLISCILPSVVALATNTLYLLFFLIVLGLTIYGFIRLLKWCFS